MNQLNKIDKKDIKVGVIGLGYVGLPLAIEISHHYLTKGFDIDKNRIDQLNKNNDVTLEISKKALKNKESLYFTSEIKSLKDCNIYIITVPTPCDEYNKPDMRSLGFASKLTGKILSKGDIVVYESTVYPGATEGYCVPILEKYSNLNFNQDFFCGYSPERINPGDKKRSLINIKKITSGSNNEIANFIDRFYNSFIKAGTYKVSSIAVAEAAKIIENTQRDVNIALINELAIIFHKLNLDTIEVLEAAGTKWNFIPFRPGLVGGHCIGVDPYYLAYKALKVGYNPEIILAGRRINDGMSKFIAEKTISRMTKLGINPIDSKIGVFGLTFKENCPDLRNSKVFDLINYLKEYHCDVSVTDPFADSGEVKRLYDLDLKKINDLQNLDVLILSVAHNVYKNISLKHWESILKDKCVFIDIKSNFGKEFFINSKINHWRL